MRKFKLSEVCEVFTGAADNKAENGDGSYLCLLPSNLNENNIIFKPTIQQNQPKNPKYILRKGDVLLKRLNPLFANVFNADNDLPVFPTSNVIVIRPNEKIDSYYLAALLELDGIEKINHFVKKGITIQAISARQLSEISLPLIPSEKQKVIGQLWQLQCKKNELALSLYENENVQTKAIIRQAIMKEN